MKRSCIKPCTIVVVMTMLTGGCTEEEKPPQFGQCVNDQGMNQKCQIVDMAIEPPEMVIRRYWYPASAQGHDRTAYSNYAFTWYSGEKWREVLLPGPFYQVYMERDSHTAIAIGLQWVLHIDLLTKKQRYLWAEPWMDVRALTAIDSDRKYIGTLIRNSWTLDKKVMVMRLSDGRTWSAPISATPTGMAFNGDILLASVGSRLLTFRRSEDAKSKLIETPLPEKLKEGESILGVLDGAPVIYAHTSNSSLRIGNTDVTLSKASKSRTVTTSGVLCLLEDGNIICVKDDGKINVVGHISMDKAIDFGGNHYGLWVGYVDWRACLISAEGKTLMLQIPPWTATDDVSKALMQE